MYILSVTECSETADFKEGEIEWRNIEKSVGAINYDDFSQMYIEEREDKEYRANWINQDMFEPYVDVMTKIPCYFEEWVRQLKIYDICKLNGTAEYFNADCRFLCFNYTDTLEKVYNIDRKHICYIHGSVKGGTPLYFGHGNDWEYEDFISSIDNENYYSVAEGYLSINDALRKPVEKILEKNHSFFAGLYDIDEVYSYGFSYGEVDRPYIRKICEYLPDHAKWYVNSYPSEEEKDSYKKSIKECGYVGTVREFE